MEGCLFMDAEVAAALVQLEETTGGRAFSGKDPGGPSLKGAFGGLDEAW